MANKQDASAQVGIEVDLKALEGQLRIAANMIGNTTKKANESAQKNTPKGGLFGSILSGSAEASSAMSNIGKGRGLTGVTSALTGLRGAFAGVAVAGGGAAASMTVVGAVIGAVALAVGAGILAFQGLKLAVSEAFNALQAAAETQAIDRALNNLVGNLGIAEGTVQTFRKELAKLDYTAPEQSRVMNSLAQSLGANGFTKEALQAASAMRDLSVSMGQNSVQGIQTMGQALMNLDTSLLNSAGVENASVLYERYANEHNKTANALSRTEKQQAILNGVILAGEKNVGLAAAASEDFGRTLTRLQGNTEALRSGLGQMFLPLATGIIGMLNTEVFGLSQSVNENENRFKSMGEALANMVLPAVRSFIDMVKAIPWVGIIDGIARTMAGFGLFAKTVSLVGQVVSAIFRVAGLTLATFGVGVERVIALFSTLGQIASAAWAALTGESSIDEFISNVNSAVSTFGSETLNLAKALYDQWDDTYSDIATGFIDTIDGMVKDANMLVNGFNIKDYWNSLPKAVKDAGDGSLNNWQNSMEGMGGATAKAIKKMNDEIAKEMADFARSQAAALRDYEEQLAEMVARHRDQIDSLRRDITKEQKSYEKAYRARTDEYQDELSKLNKADNDRKKDVETQIAEELAKGRFADQTRLAALRSRLAYEDAAHQQSVQQAKESYDQDIANAKTTHNERLTELQKSLDAELAIQAKHKGDFDRFRDYQIKDDITKLKEQYARRKEEDERAHQERLANIIKQGTEQAGEAGRQGVNQGTAAMNGLAGGIGGGIPKVKAAAKKAGHESGNATGEGIDEKKDHVKNKFKRVLIGAAAGAAVGTIFGPVGTLVGAVVGGKIGEAWPAIKEGLGTMLNKAKERFNISATWARDFVGKIGQGLAGAWGKAKQGFIDGWKAIGLPGFYTGGIVGGKSGRDANVIAATKGEMILNRDQQQRMFNLLNGSAPAGTGMGSGSGDIIVNNMTVSLPSVRNASDFNRELSLTFKTIRVGG